MGSMQRIDDHLHERMKQLVKMKNSRSLAEEYRQAIEHWIAQETQSILLADSQILHRLEHRITNAEERLAKMNGRTGMDISIVLTGILNLLAKQYGVSERQVYEELRPVAAAHFSSSKKEF
ncbi:hypothetical protein M5X02_01775 [Paenibacillus alvei]|uniref:hypothetical protein n=1 Tax=Paenibacillus alvei TaxID=44250 RepID=UPI000288492C|nr:hypothetical protein [Paenibacillus alvei]EJW14376.1 hypothetical protein PAV_14c00690 [Paenibacillus alvei DSM 29]MCY9539408.1 hypothetical protein [Paenibacillus alvei]MEC0079834.1 hypothetical protein [Paenibacillus alvei]